MVYDGAMGTNIQFRNLLDDYWGKEDCNELLVLSRPDMIATFMRNFLGWAAMWWRPTRSARSRIVLAEFGLEDRVREVN